MHPSHEGPVILQSTTSEGHIVGMLDRDQRTAKLCSVHRQSRQQLIPEPSDSFISPELVDTCGISRRSSPRTPSKNGQFWKSLLRLKHALIVGAYLSLVTFPSISSAPTHLQEMAQEQRQGTPPWFNPCGYNEDDLTSHGPQTVDDADLLKRLTAQIRITLGHAEAFKGTFAKETFKSSDNIDGILDEQEFDWLPTKSDIPKKLGKNVSKQHLDSLELDTALVDTYKNFQTIAAGLEQVVLDHQDNANLKDTLAIQEHFLRMVLCEIQSMIIEHNLKIHPNVERNVVPKEARRGDVTEINIRGWLIFRSYLITLEYASEVFNHFLDQVKNGH